MSSTNTWFSKIALAQHVVSRLLPDAMNAVACACPRVSSAQPTLDPNKTL